MPGMILDDETDGQLQKVRRLLPADLPSLDLARVQYYQLRSVSSTDPHLDHLLEKVVQLVREREALSGDLDKLENLSWTRIRGSA